MRRAVFLDRDGVLNQTIVRNRKPYPPPGPAELEVLPGVAEACTALKGAGFLLIVVTNQPDVARGTQRRDVVEAINSKLCTEISIDDIRVCYHDEQDGCICRKPRPGLLLHAARDWNVDLKISYLVGDRWKDIEAGRRAGCTTVLIDYGYVEAQQSMADYRAGSLAEAVDWIISRVEIVKQGGQCEYLI